MISQKRNSGFIIASSLLLILFFLLSFSTSSNHQATGDNGQPSALTADSTLPFDLQEVVERASHIPVPLSSDSLQVDSPAHRALFTPQGWVFTPRVKEELKPELSFSYRLSSISSGSMLLYQQGESSPSPTSCENRISYYRGEGITERYIATSQGIEQQFLLERPLQTEGDLIIRGRITTDLLANTYDSTVGIEFQSRGRTVVTYGAARVEDSRGQFLNNLPISIEGDELCLVVRGEWLREASYPVLIDPLVSSYTTISDANNLQSEPRVAYNSTDNTYLVVWEDARFVSNYRIYGQRVNADGSLIGSNLPIWSTTGDSRYPDVAYSHTDNIWLVVWQGEYESKWSVLCRGVTNSGGLFPSVSAYFVSTQIDTNQKYPRVAYNSTENNFCVVWEDDRNAAIYDWEVYSRIVGTDAAPIGSENATVSDFYDQNKPAIAYLSSVNGYMVVWQDNYFYSTLGWDIWCCLVNKDGVKVGNLISVTLTDKDQLGPAVAANTINNNFLVVWEDYRSDTYSDIYGQRMSSATPPAQVGSEIDICTANAGQYFPEVCYSPGYNGYLVAWEDHRTEQDFYGQMVMGDGTKEGGNIKLCTQDGVREAYPHLAWNPSHLNFFLVWVDNRNELTTGWDIFGRKVTYESTILTGMGYGGNSWYKAFDIYGRRFQNVKAFGAVNANGEIDVKVADLWKDGTPEVVVAHGYGGNSWIKIFNYDGTLYNSIKCFGASNTGGQVHLAVGDFDANPFDLEIAVATGRNGNNWVKVFETYDMLRASFKAYGAANTEGEVYLAAADFNGDGEDEIITGTGIGGNSRVKIFDKDGTIQSSFYAFGSENTQGSIHLAGGNFDANTADKEIAVATGQGGTNRVKIFEQDGTLNGSFKAFGSAGNPNGSVHISAVEIGAFAGVVDEILCGQGYGGSSWVKLFSWAGTLIQSLKAYGATNANGEVYVSGCRSH